MLEYASFTAIGSRDENQDRLLVLTNEADGIYWFAVADGMGGHRCGGQAAEVAIAAIERSWLADSHTDSIPDLIGQLISKAHRAVSDLTEKEELQPPQTTLAILVISPFGNYSGHIGDTRVIQYSQAGLVKRTRDHSVTEMKYASGEISDSEMALDPDHNLITQALGGTHPLDIRIEEWTLPSGDLICLASDGAWSLLQDGDYKVLLGSPDIRVATSELLNQRMRLGPDNPDNATVVAIRKQAR
jgi:serine/threonine protein phosphatase PrpC